MTDNNTRHLEYTRRLYDNVMDWYRNADAKAQVILAIDGGFIAFVSSTIFAKPDELRPVLDAFVPVTWLILVLMMVSLLGSIGTSIYCLWSRIYSGKEIQAIIRDATVKAFPAEQSTECYPPSIVYFFQFIERLDKDRFVKTLEAVDPQFELESLTNQIYILSGNVRKKHFAVNLGFVLVAIALIMFFGVAGSYMLVVL